MNRPKILTIIPARKGSKGIPSKNKKKILGKPLVEYSLEIASNLPDNYYPYISTDDPEIIEMSFEKNPQILGDEKIFPNALDMKNWKRGPDIEINFYE